MSRQRKPKFAVLSEEDKPDLETVESWISSAKVAASKAMRICAPAIKALHPVFCDPKTGPAPGTFAVDKYYRLYICTSAVHKWVELAKAVSPSNPCRACNATEHHPIAYLAGAICHEAWHPLRKHMDRAQDMGVTNFMKWNWATDEEINDDLMEIFRKENMPRLCIPPTHLILPKDFQHDDGKLAEHYYYLHTANAEEGDQSGDAGDGQAEPGQSKSEDDDSGDAGDGQAEPGQSKSEDDDSPEGDQSGQGEGDQSGQGEGDQSGQGEGDQSGQGTTSGSGWDNQGQEDDHGSAVDGRERPWDLGEPKDDGNWGLSEAEGRMIRKAVAKRIQEASKSRGAVPGGWQRWADKELEGPKYDWRAELRKAIRWSVARAAGDEERTYRRLGRRCASIGYKAILPSTFNPAPVVAVVQDTSGSMSEKAISTSISEAEGIIRAVGCDISWVACDMAADKAQRVQDVRRIQVHGGGGTDMRIGINAALDTKPRPNVVVLFTDGYTPWPDEPLVNNTRLVVGLVGESSCEVNKPPPWATVIKIVGDDIQVRQGEV